MASVSTADDLSPRHRRLLFRAMHRGTKECDLMVGGFVRVRMLVTAKPAPPTPSSPPPNLETMDFASEAIPQNRRPSETLHTQT